MKKILYLLGIVAATLLFASCQEELENWYSNTEAYDGRFVVATTCEEYSSDDTSIEDGLELMFYNTADNVSDEIWLDTEVAGQHIKGRFKLTGSPSSFKGNEIAENIASDSYYIDTDYGWAPFSSGYAGYFRVPTAAGQLNDGVQLYTRITLLEGQILPEAATSIGGNTTDSLYVTSIMHHDFVQFESYRTPEEEWDDAEVPEYAWRVKPGTNTPATAADWDEHWTLAGYRYTGMPEDR